jgi:FkbM family methyltransferase
MIYSCLLFPLQQRIFWKNVRKRRAEWSSRLSKAKEVSFSVSPSIQISLDPADELSQHIYSGAFEWEEREWLAGVLKPGDVFYDIGANIGYFSLLASEWCGSNGKVISFEPVSKTFNRLKKNIQENPGLNNIRFFQVAASDLEEEREIYISLNGKDAWNSLAGNAVAKQEATTEKIKTIPVDRIREKENLPAPTIMKIDVEGWEVHVLQGAMETLRISRPKLLIEFTRENLHTAGTSGAQLAETIHSLNYTLYSYNARHRKLIEVTDFSFEHQNLIGIPR